MSTETEPTNSTRARTFAKLNGAIPIILSVAFTVGVAWFYAAQQRAWRDQVTLEVQMSSAPLMATTIPTRGDLRLQTANGKEKLIQSKDWASTFAKPFSRLRFDLPTGSYRQAIFFPDPLLQEVEIIGVRLIPHGREKPTDVFLDRLQGQAGSAESRRTQESVTFKRVNSNATLAINIRIIDLLERANSTGSVFSFYFDTGLFFLATLFASYYWVRWLLARSFRRGRALLSNSLPPSLFVRVGIILGLVACMAAATPENSHPDEYLHVAAARYYVEHSMLPAIDNEWVVPTFSHYGFTYLAAVDIGYFFAGKFLLFFGALFPNIFVALRFFNVALFAMLLLWSIRVFRESPATLILFLTPQLWYAFSAYNTEGWAFFVSLLLVGQIASKDSSLQRYLASTHFRNATPLLLPALLCSCLLLLTKRNFFLVFLFFASWLVWQLIMRRFGLRGLHGVMKILPLILLPLLLRFGAQIYENALNKGDLSRAIHEQAERYARPDFKASALGTDKSFEGLHLKQRGVSLREVLIGHQWLSGTIASFFGTYGWMTTFSPNWFYLTMAVGWLIFGGCTFMATFTKPPKLERVFCGVAWLHLPLMVAIAVYYSWTSDFQSQGRYLFPFLPILFFLIDEARPGPRWLLVPTVWGLFLLSACGFIFFGLRPLVQ